jgi:hypothetical protein
LGYIFPSVKSKNLFWKHLFTLNQMLIFKEQL